MKARGRVTLTVALGITLMACSHPWVDASGRQIELVQGLGRGDCPRGVDRIVYHQRTYVGELEGIGLFIDATPLPYVESTSLPVDARFTGYHSGDRELWVSPTVGEAAIFIVSPDGVQQWPWWQAGCL